MIEEIRLLTLKVNELSDKAKNTAEQRARVEEINFSHRKFIERHPIHDDLVNYFHYEYCMIAMNTKEDIKQLVKNFENDLKGTLNIDEEGYIIE